MRRTHTVLSAAAAAGALVAVGLAAAPNATAAPHRDALAHTKPTWVGQAKSLGAAKSSVTSSVRVYLAPKGGTDALKAAVAAVSSPSSSGYGHYLSAAQYHAQYDATADSVATVKSFLTSNGLDVTSVAAHNTYLTAQGTNAAMEKTFGISLEKFKHQGQVVRANTSAATLPANVSSLVTTVTGLDTTANKLSHSASPPPAGFRNGRPCSRTYGAVDATYKADFKTKLPKFQGKTLPVAVCGYTGPLFRAAYEGANPEGLTGAGVTVAVLDAYAAPSIKYDSNRYASDNGDGSYVAGQLTQVLPPTFEHGDTGPTGCGASGWYGEETLDVEAVHAMAPDANIRYYGAKSCYDTDFLDAQQKIVNDDAASIVTNSYGEAEQYITSAAAAAETQVFMQAAMQGISFLFSSGDNGDELANTGIKQADSSAVDPYVTAVGGTADAIDSSGSFLFQTGWGTQKYSLSSDGKSWSPIGYLYGAGGGQSALYNKPTYQNGVVPSSYGSGRQVPDVAMDADPTTGMLVGETQTFSDGTAYGEYRIGGTSLASPLFAGMAALASQHAGGRLGFLNPTIYGQAGSTVFNDIQGKPADAGNVRVDYANGEDASGGLLYSVRTFNQDSSLAVKPGWDNVTGVGSPNSTWLTSFN